MTNDYRSGETDRMSIQSQEFADSLYTVLKPYLPDFAYPASRVSRTSKGTSTTSTRRPACGLNSNIRLYRYTQGQHFGQHYDDAVTDPVTGLKSEWTLLIYLSGIEDGVIGGEVSSFVTKFAFRFRWNWLIFVSSYTRLSFTSQELRRKTKIYLSSLSYVAVWRYFIGM